MIMQIAQSGKYAYTLCRAAVAELVDAHDSKSCLARGVGSTPTSGTIDKTRYTKPPFGGFVLNGIVQETLESLLELFDLRAQFV